MAAASFQDQMSMEEIVVISSFVQKSQNHPPMNNFAYSKKSTITMFTHKFAFDVQFLKRIFSLIGDVGVSKSLQDYEK